MIVCSCNVLSDKEIRCAATRNGPLRAKDVHGCLGCRPCCGGCVTTIRSILADAASARTVCDSAGQQL